MADLRFLADKGCPLERQRFTWKDFNPAPISKLDDDAFSRVRAIVLHGIETDALRVKHAIARFNGDLRVPLAEVRRVEQHQAAMVGALIAADHSALECTIACEQAAIEVTAEVAQHERDPYLAQVYRFGLLEDFDHLYRYAALLDRLEGKDANHILQGYTDIVPGRAAHDEHRAPVDDLRQPYDRRAARLSSKLHAVLVGANEARAHDYYLCVGPQFADPAARMLYAEIAALEEQHATQYGSLQDPTEAFLEKWLLHEASEAYLYHSAMLSEPNPRLRALWERFFDYELGHLDLVARIFRNVERRDPAELLAFGVPPPLSFTSQRPFVRAVLEREVGYRAVGTEITTDGRESEATRALRGRLNATGSPSDSVAADYRWSAGTELARHAA